MFGYTAKGGSGYITSLIPKLNTVRKLVVIFTLQTIYPQ
jgi:hypothetical protein